MLLSPGYGKGAARAVATLLIAAQFVPANAVYLVDTDGKHLSLSLSLSLSLRQPLCYCDRYCYCISCCDKGLTVPSKHQSDREIRRS